MEMRRIRIVYTGPYQFLDKIKLPFLFNFASDINKPHGG
jgi:hypothetical protein